MNDGEELYEFLGIFISCKTIKSDEGTCPRARTSRASLVLDA